MDPTSDELHREHAGDPAPLPNDPFSLPIIVQPGTQAGNGQAAGASTPAYDPEIYKAWKDHMVNGYKQNRRVFMDVMDAFMRPYWMTVWMYRVMFAVGILGFILAVVLGVTQGLNFALLFGGLSVANFLLYFLSRPLQSMEQNLQFITWLGIIYNTYWTRLMFASDPNSVQKDLEEITKTAVSQLSTLVDKQANLTRKRPDLPADQNGAANP